MALQTPIYHLDNNGPMLFGKAWKEIRNRLSAEQDETWYRIKLIQRQSP